MNDSKGIGFLLGFAALPLLACGGDDGDASGTGDSTTGDDDDDDDDDDNSVTDPDASVTDPDASVTDPDTSASADSSSSDPTVTVTDATDESTSIDPTESSTDPTTSTDSGSTDAGTTGESDTIGTTGNVSESDTDGATTGMGGCPADIEVPDACTAYAANIVVCYPDYARYEAYIAMYCACYVNYTGPMYGDNCPAALEEVFACLGMADCDDIEAETACTAEIMNAQMECGG